MRSDHLADLIQQVQTQGSKDPKLARRITDLVCVTELMATIHASENNRELLDKILLSIMGQFPVRRALIAIRGEKRWRAGMRKGYKKKRSYLSKLPMKENLFAQRGFHASQAEKVSREVQNWATESQIDWILPLRNDRKLVGLVGLGGAMLGDPSEDQIALLDTLADFAGIVLGDHLAKKNMEQLNKKLQQHLFQLRTLYEMAGSFARCYEEKEVYEVLAKNLMGLFFISRCMLLAEHEDHFDLVYYKGLKLDKGLCFSRTEISDATAWCQKFLEEHKMETIIPVKGEGEFRGQLFLGKRLNGQALSEEDIEFLTAIASQAASALETVALHRQMLEKKRMERELQIARDIQTQLLPKSIPQPPGYEISVEMRPYQQVGGDFYDVIPLSEGRFAIVIADVSGKSLPASMIMTTTQSCLRAIAGLLEISPVQAIQKLNQQLVYSTQSNRYVTLFFAVLDPINHTLWYINAGHNQPIMVYNEKSCKRLDKGGMVVGLFPDPPYESECISIEKGTQLLIFTDGLSEIVDDGTEEFGEERLEQILLNESKSLTAEDTKELILKRVMEFGHERMIDDLTLMVLRRNPDP